MGTRTKKDDLRVKRAPEIGDRAPDFELRDDEGQMVKLAAFRGSKNVLLVFYPAAFTRTCTTEFCTLRDDNADLAGDENLEIFGVSCDPIGSLRAWKKSERYPNRFLSDFWPHGTVSKAFGAFDERIGAPLRCTFLVDKEGIIRYVERNPLEKLGEARPQDAWRAAVAQLD